MMKKIRGLSVFCILAILPMVVYAATGDIVDVADPENATDAGQSSDAVTADTYPKYALATVAENDASLASTAYVKGAYNAAIKAVNKLQDVKQDVLSSTNVNVIESGGGAMVNDVSANNGTVTITKSEVTIPVGATTSITRATIWLE